VSCVNDEWDKFTASGDMLGYDFDDGSQVGSKCWYRLYNDTDVLVHSEVMDYPNHVIYMYYDPVWGIGNFTIQLQDFYHDDGYYEEVNFTMLSNIDEGEYDVYGTQHGVGLEPICDAWIDIHYKVPVGELVHLNFSLVDDGVVVDEDIMSCCAGNG